MLNLPLSVCWSRPPRPTSSEMKWKLNGSMLEEEFLCLQRGRGGKRPICESIKERNLYNFYLPALYFPLLPQYLTSLHSQSSLYIWKPISEDLWCNIIWQQVWWYSFISPEEVDWTPTWLHIHLIPHIHNRETPHTTTLPSPVVHLRLWRLAKNSLAHLSRAQGGIFKLLTIFPTNIL